MSDRAASGEQVLHQQAVDPADVNVVHTPAVVSVVVEVATSDRYGLSGRPAHDPIVAAADLAVLEGDCALHRNGQKAIAESDGGVVAASVPPPESLEDQTPEC